MPWYIYAVLLVVPYALLLHGVHTEADGHAALPDCYEDAVLYRPHVPGDWECIALDDLMYGEGE